MKWLKRKHATDETPTDLNVKRGHPVFIRQDALLQFTATLKVL